MSLLEARIQRAVREDGLVSLTLRQTESGAWQCITNYRDNLRRGLCVRGNEIDATLGALDDALRVRPNPNLRLLDRSGDDEGVFG